MTTVLETLDKGTAYLTKKGIEDARRNMQMLVAHQLCCTRMDLYLRFDQALEEKDLAPLREMLKKRGEGVPVQHLVGSVFFHKREFKSDGRGLIPRPETEELAEWVLKNATLPQASAILDMGCGSGVLGLTLAAEKPAAQVVLADLSPDALALSAENAKTLEIANVEFVASDLFSGLGDRSFDLIVANLPYVPEADRNSLAKELAYDPDLALFGGPDGMDLIRRFVPEAANRLLPGGWLALEIGIDQAAETESLLRAAGLTDIRTIKDLSGIARFPVARRA
ncbi:peptide chain release factor N(5)-glutamine methyltransferase [Luteolibacter sp. GHJ8]|jgi:release factor glutamine methyltransferase|uniref:Release factor glutamine methyltransferase n=1 Tax=Luteolibacter rhizosphaerae TaxID=2989719 RepID=A0ABT3FXE0_9BACT|nr:peptide chain release factor N(5)-glutamine methyltransferase [Luteolibacter rhizosphaerae]MCW1912237.1 peptide chain release factor N(5)-glutamine methyltransferase [Luteolibacter rhizosphaerae]